MRYFYPLVDLGLILRYGNGEWLSVDVLFKRIRIWRCRLVKFEWIYRVKGSLKRVVGEKYRRNS